MLQQLCSKCVSLAVQSRCVGSQARARLGLLLCWCCWFQECVCQGEMAPKRNRVEVGLLEQLGSVCKRRSFCSSRPGVGG